MGADTLKEVSQDWTSKLKLHQEVEDPIFGLVEILRCTEPPYQYIMKYRRSFIAKDNTYDSFVRLIRKFQVLQNKSLARLHQVFMQEEVYVCTKAPTIYCYLSYYNFTLKKAFDRKKSLEGSFSEADLWYVAITLIQLAKYLKDAGIALGQYGSNRIYLAPDGSLKLYLLNVLPENQHNPYFQILAEPQLWSQYLLSPQQVAGLSQSEYEITFDIYKSDVFVIGMVILEMATLVSLDRYYNPSTKTINMRSIRRDVEGLKGQYSPEFMSLMGRLLEENPNSRPDVEAICQFVRRVENTLEVARQSSGLRMTQEDSLTNKRKKAIESRRQKLQQQHSSYSNTISQTVSLQTNPVSNLSDKSKSHRKSSVLPANGVQETRPMSVKSRDITPLRRNPDRVNTIAYKNSKYSLLDPPFRTFKRRFE